MLRYTVEEAEQMSETAADWCRSAHSKAQRVLKGLRQVMEAKGLSLGIELSDASVVADKGAIQAMAAVGMLQLWAEAPPAYVTGF